MSSKKNSNQLNKEITSKRKTEHIRINLEEDVQSRTVTLFEDLYFENQALPEFNLEQIETSQLLFGHNLPQPFLISSMTGGTDEAWQINQKLAAAAQRYGFAMGLGSQRAALEDKSLEYTYKIRAIAPDILLFANLGAVQLNYGFSIDQCQKAVDMIEADALILHLNPLQEALQPEGNTNFSGLLQKIEKVCKALPIPIIVKEVGWGISGKTAVKLVDAGVSAIDVAGAGGTSWAKVEMHRIKNKADADIASAFFDWGIPTVEAIRQIKQINKTIPVFASGGIRHGVDAAKTIALGACLAGMAGAFLRTVNESEEALDTLCQRLIKELRIAMFAAGAPNLQELHNIPLYNWRNNK